MLRKIVYRIGESLNDLASFKVQVMIAWFIGMEHSGYKTDVVVCAFFLTMCALYMKDIQAKDSNLAEVMKVIFARKDSVPQDPV